MSRERGVEGASFLDLRWRTRQSRSTLGQRSDSPETLWPILYPLTQFLCAVNVIVTKVAALRFASVAVATKILGPQLKLMSSRQKGVLSELGTVYSPGRRGKKYSIIVMSHSL